MLDVENLLTSNDGERRTKLKDALTLWRSRLKPTDVGLPSTNRRRVTGLRREEVAELTGVSSDWYRWFESGRPIRVSLDFVNRVAEALVLDNDERSTLFALALPEAAAAIAPCLRAESTAVIDAISSVRRAARRLWHASSSHEMMTIVAESAAEHFKDCEIVGSCQRLQPGKWDYPIIVGEPRVRTSDLHVRLHHVLTPEQTDESMLHGALVAPGSVGTWRETLENTVVGERVRSALISEGFNEADCLAARIDSGDGVRHTLFLSYLSFHRAFTDYERTMLGALADMASLAARSSLE